MELKHLKALLLKLILLHPYYQTGTYTITFSSAHPAGANYVIQLTSYYSVVSVRSSVAPSSTGFGVVTWAASSRFPTGQNNAFYFTVTY